MFKPHFAVPALIAVTTFTTGPWIQGASAQTASTQKVASPWNLPGPAPHLLAHYMPWFQVHPSANDATFSWNHWKWMGAGAKHDPAEKDASGRRNLASVYYPLIGPYSSWSRNVIRYHLKTAHAAGIQGFLCIWYGPGSTSDAQIPMLLEEAEKLGMRIAICYEEKLNFPGYRTPKTRQDVIQGATQDLSYIVEHYGSHPAYLKRNGVPFIYQFNAYGKTDIGPRMLTPEEWGQVLSALPKKVVYGRQNLDPAYHPPIDAVYQWWSSDPKRIDWFADRASSLVAEGKLSFWMSMIAPGFDDTGVWGWGNGPRVTPRAGLSLLKGTFDRAFKGNPELIQIVTWNDFNEGTVVEPTRETGFTYLDAIETWWGAKTGRPVNLEDNRAPFLEYAASATPEEKAELPPNFGAYLEKKPLTVEVPDYLTILHPDKN